MVRCGKGLQVTKLKKYRDAFGGASSTTIATRSAK
jgi:hypothetical protein